LAEAVHGEEPEVQPVRLPGLEDLQLLTVAEVARVLHLGETRTWRLISSGEIRSLVVGTRARRVTRAAVEDYLVARTAREQRP
jgi:excisionase family DNA binding protein